MYTDLENIIIKSLRKERQKEVAIKLGVSISVVNRWANGEMMPGCRNIEKLMKEGYIKRKDICSIYSKKNPCEDRKS